MAKKFNDKDGHWITTKDGKHIFIQEDLIDKQDREIKEQQKLTNDLAIQHNQIQANQPTGQAVDYSKVGTRSAAVVQFEKDTGLKVKFDPDDDNICTKTNLYMVLNTIADLKRRYPRQLRFLKAVGSYHETPSLMGGVSMAQANMKTNEIEIHDYVFSMHNPILEKMYKSSTVGGNNYHPKGTTAKDVLTHELGHIMFNEYIGRLNRRLTGHDWADMFDVSLWARNQQGAGSGTTAKYIQGEINKALTTALQATPQPNVLGYANPKFNHPTAISGYAAVNPHELMAEAVADYIANGPKASPLSKELVKLLHL